MAIMNTAKPNKLGWITSATFDFENDYADVTSFSDSSPLFINRRGLIRGSVDFTTADYGAVHEFMEQLRSGTATMPTFQKEFMCLYCGSPNSVELSHCKKCGAPRSFVIG
jgi:hypothetical protein